MFYMLVKGYAYSHTQKDTHLTLNTVEKSSPYTAQGGETISFARYS